MQRLTLGDRPVIEAITSTHAPLSDFNFTSMWCWDIDESLRWGTSGDTILVQFRDYVSGGESFSLMGRADVVAVAEGVRHLAPSEPTTLSLLSEEVAGILEYSGSWAIAHDPDNDDYLVDVNVYRNGGASRGRRGALRAFWRDRDAEKVVLDPRDPSQSAEVLGLFERWAAQAGQDASGEKAALARCLSSAPWPSLIAAGLRGEDGVLVAFEIVEIAGRIGNCHFQKADLDYHRATYRAIDSWSGDVFHSAGGRTINLEQDLGLPGLRQAKSTYRPHSMLRKFTATAPPLTC